MQLVDDPDAASWLDELGGAADDFDWDEGNRVKNRKHDVDPVDVEAMFQSPLVFAGRIIGRPHDEPPMAGSGGISVRTSAAAVLRVSFAYAPSRHRFY